MDSSNSLSCTIRSLEQSEHEEDNDLAAECMAVIKEILAKLRPILKYVVSPARFTVAYQGEQGEDLTARCAILIDCSSYCMLLSEPGAIFNAGRKADGQYSLTATDRNKGRQAIFHELQNNGDDRWKNESFEKMVEVLQELLTRAQQKREQHLASVSSAKEKLTQILAVVKS